MKKIVLLITLLCYFTVSFCVPIALAGPSDFVNSIFNSAYSNVTTQSPSAFVSQGENIYSLGYSFLLLSLLFPLNFSLSERPVGTQDA